ncbi:MAG: hypothetical protein K0S79_194 [Nitrospira sp.]|jgi:hypothetical protein|nr:hypothetical protein [Nitrospira sp.]
MNSDIAKIVDQFIQLHGESKLRTALGELNHDELGVLTIIANAGIHPLHPLHERGEIFAASTGNLDFSDEAMANQAINEALRAVARKLKEKRWKRVYIVPFGPAILSMQIKAVVYKVLNIDSIDVLHAGGGIHYDIEIDSRAVALG